MRTRRFLFPLGITIAVLSLASLPAGAATATNTFAASIIIQSSCQAISTNALDFGTQGSLGASTDAQATFAIQCTSATPYNIGLDTGLTAGGTVATRLMASGSGTVAYKMYSDVGRTTNWGNSVGTDAVTGTGTGSQQTLTIYGRVPTQSTPRPATYTDTVTLTVTY